MKPLSPKGERRLNSLIKYKQFFIEIFVVLPAPVILFGIVASHSYTDKSLVSY